MKPRAFDDSREDERGATKIRDTVVICKSIEKYTDRKTGRVKEVMHDEMTATYDGEHWNVSDGNKYTPREFMDAIDAKTKKYVVPGPETSSEWHKAREVFK